MNTRAFVVVFLFFPQVAWFQENEKKTTFLVPQDSVTRHGSKNELKENIGEKLKQALYSCTAIASELSKLQQELAALQHRLLGQVESLVENKRCFKKARRRELCDACEIMTKVEAQLTVQKENIKKMAFQMNKSSCLKEAHKT